MARPGVYTADIFKLADECLEAGYFSGLDDRRYVLVLRFKGSFRAEIHRAHVDCLLPSPCRVWLVKGKIRKLLGDSASLPAGLPDGVGPPFIG